MINKVVSNRGGLEVRWPQKCPAITTTIRTDTKWS